MIHDLGVVYHYTPDQVLAMPLGMIAALASKPKDGLSLQEAAAYAERRAVERAKERDYEESLRTGGFWNA